jgi:TRAP-type C4-dicarboxylate transport system substrate-binding protein
MTCRSGTKSPWWASSAWSAAAVVALTGWVGAGAAQAQTKLRVGDSLPVNHFFAENATKYWMGEVTKKTNGAIQFEYFPAEQLGKAKDMMSLTQSGVIDIGYVVPTYVQDKMPHTTVAELPGAFVTSCQGTMAFWRLAQGDGVLNRRDYVPNGMRVVFAIVMPPYQIFSGGRMLSSLKSLDGMKLRTTGGAQDTLVTRLKAVPVRMAAPELHESLSRGTVDGAVFPAASILSYNIEGLLKSAIVGESFGSAVLTYMISENRWRALPQEVRTAMAEAGEATTRRICAYADRELASDIEKIRAKGAVMVSLPGADKAQLATISASVRDEWAQSLDARGRGGSEVLKAFTEALK